MRLCLPLLLVAFFSCSPPTTGPVPETDAGETIEDAGELEPGDRCEGVTCDTTETCVDGNCVARTCGTVICGADERCSDAGVCIDAACFGVECIAGLVCAQGSCVATDCAGMSCPSGFVCAEDLCVDASCLGVECDGGACVAGACQPDTCGDAGVCPATHACIDSRCEDARCVGVTCTPGNSCDAGTCVTGCNATQPTETSCANSSDDDCDGLVDCADPDCSGRACTDDARACSRDVCNSGVCTHPAQDAGVVCRASTGGCDVAETCNGTALTCPTDAYSATCMCPFHGPLANYAEHDGLRAISAGNFVLRDTNTWTSYAATFDALGLTRVGLDVLPLNRTATSMGSKPWPGFGGGFYWDSGDLNVAYWIPQGLAGGTAGARSYTAVAWHYEDTGSVDPNPPADGTEKGVRISFADVTSLSAGVTYRHVLLVEPDGTRGIKPVGIHAGGLAWSGSYLYVADTSRGLRVFDLSRISRVSTAAACATRGGKVASDVCAYGYEYVLPQVGGYYFPSGLSTECRPKFSYVALDRSTTPDSLISGEYDNDPTVGLYSRVLRWPLVAGTSRLNVGSTGVVKATGAWYAGNRNVQGAIASGSKFFLNSTRYAGALMTGTVGAASRVLRASDNDWGWMPEGMYISAAGNLWVCTEGHANMGRGVYYARIADIP